MANHARIHLAFGGWANNGYWFLQFQQDNKPTAPYFLALFGFAFTVILNFLELKYQNNDDEKAAGPFQSHPITMHVAVASLLMYCLLYGIHQRFSSHPLYWAFAHVIARSYVFFALLALLSTASLLFPGSVRWVFYALCILLSAGDWLHSLLQKIMNRFSEIQVNGENVMMMMRIMRFPSMEHRLRLQV